MAKLRKWRKARDLLTPFLRDQATDGLVLLKTGEVDLSVTGTARTLKKAAIVHLYCGLQMGGAAVEVAIDTCTLLHPNEDAMSSRSTIYRYLKQFFAHGACLLRVEQWEVGQTKRVVEPHSHVCKERNRCKVMQDKHDPEAQKYFIAKHAEDHLNELLLANADLRCSITLTLTLTYILLDYK
jgi:hypothetical protein